MVVTNVGGRRGKKVLNSLAIILEESVWKKRMEEDTRSESAKSEDLSTSRMKLSW